MRTTVDSTAGREQLRLIVDSRRSGDVESPDTGSAVHGIQRREVERREIETPTLVVTDPPHVEVDLNAAAALLGLDAFATGLKAKFTAPEILSLMEPVEASRFAVALRATGLSVSLVYGRRLAELPWPDPVSTLAFDGSCVRASIGNDSVEVAYDAEVVAVYCRPPADFVMKPTVDLHQAVASGHGPTIAEAIQWLSAIDLYTRQGGALRRITIVPDLLSLDGEAVVRDLGRRFKRVRLDARLSGVRPRGRLSPSGTPAQGESRKGYSFGTFLLRQTLRSIDPELSDVTQYELGSRLAYALSPMGKAGLRG